MKTLLALTLIAASTLAHALEIDEKLTLRFLKVSNSKKTVLINRGAEDGLVVGDHAKFFVTQGVIARGVVEKVSPSRSIWSLYRVVDSSDIVDGKVLNLKIASPVKLTTDPTKSMKEEEVPAGTEKMSLDENDEASKIIDEEKKEADEMGLDDELAGPAPKKDKPKTKKAVKTTEVSVEDLPRPHEDTSKSWEAFGMLYVNSLTGTVEKDSNQGSTQASASTIDFSAGMEKYFLQADDFWNNFSLAAFIHKRTIESGEDIRESSDWFEFGGGINYHFWHSPAALNTLIGYGTFTVGAGSATIKERLTTGGVATDLTGDGSNRFVSGGAGLKYVTSSGVGVRAILDYYSSSETYNWEDNTTSKRTLSGPRIQFGFSYRF